MLTQKNASLLLIAALAASSAHLQAQEPELPLTRYMGGPVELVEAPNGAIANKRLLDGVDKVTWTKPTIEQPIRERLEGYLDGASFVLDQSLRGILGGKGPNDLRDWVRLPDYLKEVPNNLENFYPEGRL